MNARLKIVAALAELERIQQALKAIPAEAGSQGKLEMVNLRRELAAHLGVLAGLAGDVATLSAESEPERAYRSHFSAMRAAIALHQSRWPAVSVDSGSPEYLKSVAATREKSAAFIAWVKAQIGQTR